MRALVRELLGLPKRQLFMTSAPTDLSFVLTMPGEFDLTGLTYNEVPPAKNVALQKGDYFAYLAQHDLLLALPYQSINPFVDLLYEAADDPDVVSIKITLYRLAAAASRRRWPTRPSTASRCSACSSCAPALTSRATSTIRACLRTRGATFSTA